MSTDEAYSIEPAGNRGSWPITESQAIRIAARLGVWGTVVGGGCLLAMGVSTVPGAIASAVGTAGLIGGGFGFAATGILVLRARARIARRVLAGAVTAIPLGLSILVVGIASLSNSPGPRGVIEAATVTMIVTAAVLGVLIGSGVWSALKSVVETDPGPPGES